MKNTWQMCLASRLRQIVVAFFILWPLAESTIKLCVTKQFPTEMLSEPAGVVSFVLACGSGCIGRQLNDGTLSLVLSRPLTITSYALSKWLAVAIASSVASMTQLSAELIVVCFRTPYLLDAGSVLTNGIERILICFGLSAVFMFFSSLVSGSKDLAVYLVFRMVAVMATLVAEIRPDRLPDGAGRMAASLLVPPIAALGQALNFILEPKINFLPLLNHLTINWTEVTAYFSVITIFASLCIFSLNRRELPYGAD